MICSLIMYLEINVALQGKDKHIIWKQRKEVDSEITSIHNPRMEKKMILYSTKDPDAGKDWSQKEKGKAKDEMVR